MITASHNPANFNGFKIKAPGAGVFPPETTSVVEQLVDQNPPTRRVFTEQTAGVAGASIKRYREQIAAYIDLERISRQTPERLWIPCTVQADVG